MQRTNLPRTVLLFLAGGLWLFLLLSLASFHATDWPSHAVFPHPATRNLCGPVGAYVAYWFFFAIGQGVFPILFFSGVCIALLMMQSRISDLWMRTIGLMLLSIAFAAAVHHFTPGTRTGLPEGQGGIVGISAASFLQSHFNTVGTRLILMVTVLIGLLLAADDLVLRTPGMVATAYVNVKAAAPRMNLPSLAISLPKLPAISFPSLPSLPWFAERVAAPPKPAASLAKAAKSKLVAASISADDNAK